MARWCSDIAGRVEFPTFLLLVSSAMVTLASFCFGNHFKLVDGLSFHLPPLCLSKLTRICKLATGNFVPSPSSLLRSLRYPKSSTLAPLPSLTTNPFTLNPLCFALCILSIDLWVTVCVSLPFEGGYDLEADNEPNAETNSAPLIYSSLQSRFYLHSGSHIRLP